MEVMTPEREISPLSRSYSPPPIRNTNTYRENPSIYNNRNVIRRLDYDDDDDNMKSPSKPNELDMQYCPPNSECSICLQNDVCEMNGGAICCNHTFHRDCIKKWFKLSSCCPNCRNIVI